MLIEAKTFTAIGSTVVSLRCPGCRQIGTFHGLVNVNDVQVGNYALGQRRCPNPKCQVHVFVVHDPSHETLVAAYPSERIDFDTTDIPKEITATLEEAISCHAAGCFRASAIMVRRTLEVLCENRSASGPNLQARIKALGANVVLPHELLSALDDLRLLGNDAVHIESRVYNDVGQAEVEAGIAVAKEVLKAVFQYATLVNQLKALKKSPQSM
jgi:hypothetical protein